MYNYGKVLVDLNNVFKAHYSHLSPKFSQLDSNEVLKETIRSVFSSLLNLREKYLSSGGIMYVLADNPVSKFKVRKMIDPEYKANRERESDGYFRAIDMILLLCNAYDNRFCTVRMLHAEADDLVKPLIDSFGKYEKVLLVSEDLDWARAMSKNVDWYSKHKVLNLESFKEEYKFYPGISEVCLYKTVRGDKIDNIPVGLPYLPEPVLLGWINKYTTIYDVYKDLESGVLGVGTTWETHLKNEEIRSRLFRNFELVSFQNIEQSEVLDLVIEGKFKKESLRLLYTTYGIDYKSFDHRFESEGIKESTGSFFGFEPIQRV